MKTASIVLNISELIMKKFKFFFIILFLISSIYIQAEQPLVSIITSVYKGDEFIIGFLEDIVQQTIFDQCELILINANSPGNEEAVINKFLKYYDNIKYIKLTEDPGLYAVWNMGIKMAQAPLITNANLDDRKNHEFLKLHANALLEDPTVDLVYMDYWVTYSPNETFAECQSFYVVTPWEFSPQKMHKCLPGPMPMWRKSMHKKYGYFNEIFKSSGDWEMWLRAIRKGAQFKKIPGVCGLYYANPAGISTDKEEKKKHRRDLENEVIVDEYKGIWS